MTTEEVRRVHFTQPFVPYRVRVADGNHYDVRHPESLAMLGNGRLVSIGMQDHFVALHRLLVTGIERPIPKRKQGGNGAVKKRT